SKRAKPLPQALCLHGLELAVAGEEPAIVRAVRDGSDRDARERMAQAALCSGLALANSGLGFAHGVAPALGSVCRVPHGLACALMLPAAMRVNRRVRRCVLGRIGEVITGRRYSSEDAGVDAAIEKIEAICEAIDIPRRLRDVGVREDQIDDLL